MNGDGIVWGLQFRVMPVALLNCLRLQCLQKWEYTVFV